MRTMEEKDILLKTIEGLNASIASLSATNKDQARLRICRNESKS